jgi:hypothetical protein
MNDFLMKIESVVVKWICCQAVLENMNDFLMSIESVVAKWVCWPNYGFSLWSLYVSRI